MFELKLDFRAVLSTLPTFNLNQRLFAYGEVCQLLSKYILSKKDCFFDPRNCKLALVKNDLLGKAFQVDSFHRCQVTNLLRKQLIYVSDAPDIPNNFQLIISGAPPANVNAERSISVDLMIRKRSGSDIEHPSKQFRPLSALMSELAESNHKAEVEYKEEEEKSNSEDKEEEEESDSEKESVYNEEYEIDSTEEQKNRPFQAGGSNNKSSDEDSELECQKTPIRIEESDGESINWADNEDNMTIGEIRNPIKNNSIASKSWVTPAKYSQSLTYLSYQKCLGCKNMKTSRNLYCQACWQMKKDWLPDPPKQHQPDPPKPHQRTKLSSRRKRNEKRDKHTKSETSHCSNEPSNNSIDKSNPIATKTTKPMLSSLLLCMFCCTNPRNASLIHGQLGHQLCCYPCAKKLWKEQARCPVCRRKIEKIVKLIQN
jgi:E3 ubiquitin-protein ligase Mdm2